MLGHGRFSKRAARIVPATGVGYADDIGGVRDRSAFPAANDVAPGRMSRPGRLLGFRSSNGQVGRSRNRPDRDRNLCHVYAARLKHNTAQGAAPVAPADYGGLESECRIGAAQRNPSIHTQAQTAGLQGSACAKPRMMGYGRAAFTHPTAGCLFILINKNPRSLVVLFREIFVYF